MYRNLIGIICPQVMELIQDLDLSWAVQTKVHFDHEVNEH